MLLGRENISQTDSHDGASAQFCLCDVAAARSIDSVHDFAVQDVDLIFVSGDKATTDHRHDNRRRQLEALVGLNPVHEEIRQSEMITDARSKSFATKRTPDDPRLKRPESATKLDAVVHGINYRIIGIAQMHIFGRDSE